MKHVQFRIALAVAIVMVPSFHPAGRVLAQTACGGDRAQILVGGVTGFGSFADPAATAHLRATCRVGLYVHGQAWPRTSDADKASIIAAFKGTPPGALELGFSGGPENQFSTYVKPKVLDEGVRANVAVVNGLCASGIGPATRWIDTAKSYGLSTVAVVYAPNSAAFKNAPNAFSDPQYDCIRSAAELGGAIAVDAPPRFFLRNTQAYQQFVMDEIRWANSKGLASYYIVSPNKSGRNFGSDADQAIDMLVAGGARPSNYIFEAYCVGCEDAAHQTGNENDPSTVAGVAARLLPKIAR